jgi:ferredoxin
MHVKVDDERCQGHGLCRISAPDLFFAREEDGNAYVKDETVPAGREADAELAADSCPELAIEVS